MMNKAYLSGNEYNLLILLNTRYKYISKSKIGIVRLHETMPSLSDNKDFYNSDDYNCYELDLTIYNNFITFKGIEFEHGPLDIYKLLKEYQEETYNDFDVLLYLKEKE